MVCHSECTLIRLTIHIDLFIWQDEPVTLTSLAYALHLSNVFRERNCSNWIESVDSRETAEGCDGHHEVLAETVEVHDWRRRIPISLGHHWYNSFIHSTFSINQWIICSVTVTYTESTFLYTKYIKTSSLLLVKGAYFTIFCPLLISGFCIENSHHLDCQVHSSASL